MSHDIIELNNRINAIYKNCDKFYLEKLIKDTSKRIVIKYFLSKHI